MKDFKAELEGLDKVLMVLHPTAYQKALNRTVNEVGSKIKTHGVKKVRETYNIKAKEVNDEKIMKVKRSNFSTMQYSMRVRSKRLNAKRFAPKALKKKGHISIKIKNNAGRKTLKRAFTAKNGAVLMREKNSQKIRAVTTVSVAQMFNKKILKEMDDIATEEFGTKLKNNFENYIGKV